VKTLLLTFVLLNTGVCLAQLEPYRISRTDHPIQVDAVMDEPVWKQAQVATRFRQYFPADTSDANSQTEVRLTYDDHFIYVFAIMHNMGPRKYVTPSLRRDYRGEANDGVTVVLDTYQDKTNAFSFGVNPYGVQREGLISNGGNGRDDFSLNWDNKWLSAARILDSAWVAEMAIPFKSIRYKSGGGVWNINLYRIDSQYGERSTWSPIPRNFNFTALAFLRELHWDQPLRNPGPNISLIPYTSWNMSENFEEGTPRKTKAEIGGDAKIAIGPALNLDLTVNPDFSQVEVDQQVTNLDRFEIFFPERRQFFLENADLFADFGQEGNRPFFSRRIGITRDTSTGQNIENPIYFGTRLSGKINNNLRLGFLSMQAAEDKDIGLPSTNYTVATLQQKVFSRSNISFIAINKQAFQDSIGGEFTASPSEYNRLLGVDYNLATSDNRWTGKLYYHHSFEDNQPDSAFSLGGRIAYGTLKWDISATLQDNGANYNPEAGFVRRKDILRLAPTAWYNFYPSSGNLVSHGPGFDFDVIGNETYGLTDYDVNLMYRARWRSTANFNLRLRQEYVYLFSPFDPTNTGGQELPAGTEYTQHMIVANFQSDARKKFYYFLNTRTGQYFNGTRWNLSGQLTYRFQPYGSISLDFSYNDIKLPSPYSSATLWLISPRLDITFSRSLFWTTFVQYNSQISNLNINSRFQWRFKPVSDLYLVYTDNYFAQADYNGNAFYVGQPKVRAVVVKLTYWLNL
jgi:hypothetical protein